MQQKNIHFKLMAIMFSFNIVGCQFGGNGSIIESKDFVIADTNNTFLGTNSDYIHLNEKNRECADNNTLPLMRVNPEKLNSHYEPHSAETVLLPQPTTVDRHFPLFPLNMDDNGVVVINSQDDLVKLATNLLCLDFRSVTGVKPKKIRAIYIANINLNANNDWDWTLEVLLQYLPDKVMIYSVNHAGDQLRKPDSSYLIITQLNPLPVNNSSATMISSSNSVTNLSSSNSNNYIAQVVGCHVENDTLVIDSKIGYDYLSASAYVGTLLNTTQLDPRKIFMLDITKLADERDDEFPEQYSYEETVIVDTKKFQSLIQQLLIHTVINTKQSSATRGSNGKFMQYILPSERESKKVPLNGTLLVNIIVEQNCEEIDFAYIEDKQVEIEYENFIPLKKNGS